MQISLRTQMALALSTLVGMALLLIGLLAMQHSVRALTNQIGAGLQNQAHSVALGLDRELQSMADLLELASGSDSFRAQTSRSARQQDLQLMQSLFPGFTWIGVTNEQGVVQAATGGHLTGVDISSRSVFRGAAEHRFIVARRPALLLQQLLRPEEPAWQVVDVASPLRDEQGHVYGVIAAHVGWDWITDQHQRIFRDRRRDDRGEAWLVQDDGRVIAGPGVYAMAAEPVLPRELWSRIRTQAHSDGGWMQAHWFDGRKVLIGVGRSGLDPGEAEALWYSVVTEDAELALAPVQELVWLLGGTAIGLALLAALVGYGLAIRISKPLKQLSEATEQLRLGHIQHVPELTASREVTQLSRALRELIESLRDTRLHLLFIREQAQRDPLTGLYNRTSLEELLEAKRGQTQSEGAALACAYLDLDGFKAINDRHGHGAGDAILQAVAERIRGSIRGEELAFRLGGDEFLLVLGVDPEQATEDARRIVQRTLDAVTRPVTWQGQSLVVGATAGVAIWPTQAARIHKALELADAALIAGKLRDKGRVWMHPLDPDAG